MLYNAQYQIQQMERRVERAKGDRSQEELKKIKAEIDLLKEECEEKDKDLHTLNQSNKQLVDEIRTVERMFEKVSED